MPRATWTSEFLVGYISGRMEQLRSLVHRLESGRALTTGELDNILLEILEIDEQVHGQATLVKDVRIKPKLLEFKKLFNMASETWEGAKNALAIKAPINASSNVDKVWDELLEEAIDVAPGMAMAELSPQPVAPDAASSAPEDELAIFASDCEEEMPLELLSTVTRTQSFQPIALPPLETPLQALARRVLEQRGTQAQPKEPCGNPASRRVDSMSSRASYVSSHQEQFTAPVTGRAFPPFCNSLPTPISRKDPTIIGRSEIYIHPPTNAHSCPECRGKHKMFRCSIMLRTNLQERWFRALRAGVCLNCMIHGHSSFRCYNVGACKKCMCRHNSILCPRNPKNL